MGRGKPVHGHTIGPNKGDASFGAPPFCPGWDKSDLAGHAFSSRLERDDLEMLSGRGLQESQVTLRKPENTHSELFLHLARGVRLGRA